MTQESSPLTRRAFLASAIAAAVSACGADGFPEPQGLASTPTAVPQPETAAAPTSSPSPTPSPTTEPSPTPEPTATPEPTPTPEPVDLDTDPFVLGVASGDPTQDAVILWTRLATLPGGGPINDQTYEITWQVAVDDTFAQVVASGTVSATPATAHAVHVDATGLDPDSWYHYRFVLGQHVSPVGRTRTTPAAGTSPQRLRIGASSCQHWERGYYGAHRHLADEDLDLMIWLGDYIYEGPYRGTDDVIRVRQHPDRRAETLETYRERYAVYRSDPQLQRSHAARPWLVTWDDHEVVNNYAGDNSGSTSFFARRAAAYQAWYEHMPVRLAPPEGPDLTIHRDVIWGDLAHLFALDGRQYRDPQATDGAPSQIPGLDDPGLGIRGLGPTALDPDHRMLGADQEDWLVNGVDASPATWTVLCQQVLMQGLTAIPGDSPLIITDNWDGYFANRRELLGRLARVGADDLVVLTGDFHAAIAGDLRADPFDRSTPVVGTEFMAGPISSGFPAWRQELQSIVQLINPHMRLFEARNGYGIAEFTPEACRMTFRAVDDALDPDTAVSTIAEFMVDQGTPGIRSA